MRALLVGLLAFVLVTQAAAAAVEGTAARVSRYRGEGEAGPFCRDARRAPAGQSRCRSQAPRDDPVLREPSLPARLDHASIYRGASPEPSRAPPRTAHEDDCVASECDSQARPAQGREALASSRHLRRLRSGLRLRRRRRLVRVGLADDRAERAVPGHVPDGLARALPLRSRTDGPRAGGRRTQVLRAVGPRLEPVELQVRDLLGREVFVANCGPKLAPRVSPAVSFW